MNVDSRYRSRALLLTVVGTVLVVIAAALFVFILSYKPAYSDSATGQSAVKITAGGRAATVELNIEQAVGSGPHNDWLGYQTLDQHPGTILHLPQNALITVIIHNFDSRTALRNTFFTLVQGTVGNVEYVNGKKTHIMAPDLTSHTFTIPDLGVSVPMEGISDQQNTAESNNPKLSYSETMKFQFRTPKGNHTYRWQCIVPCGSGLYGFGGPMSEIGYMSGIIAVS
jgi:hypothetical protein